MHDEDEHEKPLDPATERIQNKLRMLILVSGLTMAIGLVAVFSAIIYRSVKSGNVDLPIWASGELLIGKETKIISSSLDGDLALLTLSTPEGNEIMVLDMRTLTVVSRVKFVPDTE